MKPATLPAMLAHVVRGAVRALRPRVASIQPLHRNYSIVPKRMHRAQGTRSRWTSKDNPQGSAAPLRVGQVVENVVIRTHAHDGVGIGHVDLEVPANLLLGKADDEGNSVEAQSGEDLHAEGSVSGEEAPNADSATTPATQPVPPPQRLPVTMFVVGALEGETVSVVVESLRKRKRKSAKHKQLKEKQQQQRGGGGGGRGAAGAGRRGGKHVSSKVQRQLKEEQELEKYLAFSEMRKDASSWIAFGVVDRVMENAHPDRVEPACEHFLECGGCKLMHLSADAQAKLKEKILLEQFKKIGQVEPARVHEPIADEPFGYRYAARLTVRERSKRAMRKLFAERNRRIEEEIGYESPEGDDRDELPYDRASVRADLDRAADLGISRLSVGFRSRQFKSPVLNVDECPVLEPSVGNPEVMEKLRLGLSRLSRPDKVPQLELFKAQDQFGVTVRMMAGCTPEDEQVLRQLSEDTGLLINVQPGDLRSVRPLWKRPGFSTEAPNCFNHFTYELELQRTPESPPKQVRFEYSPGAFVQVNRGVNQKLVQAAMDAIDLQPGELLVDMFCGIGNFGISLAALEPRAHLLGVEADRTSVDGAQHNAHLNNLHRVHFRVRDLYKAADLSGVYKDVHRLQAQLSRGSPKPPKIKMIIDPPRSGAKELLRDRNLLSMPHFDQIVYVSCNPSTLARDASILSRRGWQLDSTQLADMFPHTGGLESISVFRRTIKPTTSSKSGASSRARA